MIGTHRDAGIRASRVPATAFLAKDGGNDGHHVRRPVQMRIFEEGARDAVALASDVPQVKEMHMCAQPIHHTVQVHVGAGAE